MSRIRRHFPGVALPRTVLSPAVLSLAVVAALVIPFAPAASATTVDTVTATYARTAQWTGGYVGTITVHNGTATAIPGWRVEFTLPAGTAITAQWGGTLHRAGDRYAFVNFPWYPRLSPGESATIGWIATGAGEPAGCTVNGAPCAGPPPAPPSDVRSPSAPGDVRVTRDPGVTIAWQASTDDVGVAGYRVYESGRLLGTVTGTSYVFTTGATLPPRVYVFSVAAIDAAGNVSPYGFTSLGAAWTNQNPPAAPTGLLVTGATPGSGSGSGAGSTAVSLAWQAVTPPAFADPPVSGYEVSVDGVPVERTGATAATVVLPAGPHSLAVRAFNVLGLFSPPAQVVHP